MLEHLDVPDRLEPKRSSFDWLWVRTPTTMAAVALCVLRGGELHLRPPKSLNCNNLEGLWKYLQRRAEEENHKLATIICGVVALSNNDSKKKTMFTKNDKHQHTLGLFQYQECKERTCALGENILASHSWKNELARSRAHRTLHTRAHTNTH